MCFCRSRARSQTLNVCKNLQPVLDKDLNIFVSSLYYGDADSQARLKLSRLVQYPNVIWSLMYHELLPPLRVLV